MSLRAIIQHIAQARGLVLEDPKPGDAETFFRFRVPAQRGTLDLDEQLLSIQRNAREATVALLDREVTSVQRTLSRATTDYIAHHDRDPLDRLRQIEAAGRALLDALGPVGFSRTGDALTKAALDLEQLLRLKPGAASWQRHGYGKDPDGPAIRKAVGDIAIKADATLQPDEFRLERPGRPRADGFGQQRIDALKAAMLAPAPRAKR